MDKKMIKEVKEMYYQQGDVIIEKIETLPQNLKSLPHRVLADGEVTGHKHVVAEEELSDLFVDENGNLFLKTSGRTTVKHEEHKPITIEPGNYKIRRVQEYDHFEEEARNVRD